MGLIKINTVYRVVSFLIVKNIFKFRTYIEVKLRYKNLDLWLAASLIALHFKSSHFRIFSNIWDKQSS